MEQSAKRRDSRGTDQLPLRSGAGAERPSRFALVSPWVRDLRTGVVRRYLGKDVVASVWRDGKNFMFDVPPAEVTGFGQTDTEAKSRADIVLREGLQLRLANAPRGYMKEE